MTLDRRYLALIPLLLTLIWAGGWFTHAGWKWNLTISLLWLGIIMATAINLASDPSRKNMWLYNTILASMVLIGGLACAWLPGYLEYRNLYSYRSFEFISAFGRIINSTKLIIIASLATAPIAIMLAIYLFFQDLLDPATSHIEGKRKRSKSDLHGNDDFMSRKKMLEMSREPGGIILGQLEGIETKKEKKMSQRGEFVSRKNAIISYPLEGNAFMLGIPRTGKM